MGNQPTNIDFVVDVVKGDVLEVQGDILLLSDWRGRSTGNPSA